VLNLVDSGDETEHAHEETGSLLVADCSHPPLLEPSPEPFDDTEVGVEPIRTDHRRLISLSRDRSVNAV
jgi:hypothetical protein